MATDPYSAKQCPTTLDRDAILEGLQDQIDELTDTVMAQQRELEALRHLVTQPAGGPGPSGHRGPGR